MHLDYETLVRPHHWLSILVGVGLVSFGFLSSGSGVAGLYFMAVVMVGWGAWDYVLNNYHERAFIIVKHPRELCIVILKFNRVVSRYCYDLDLLIECQIEQLNFPTPDSRIVAVLSNGVKLPFRVAFHDTNFTAEINRMNEKLSEIIVNMYS